MNPLQLATRFLTAKFPLAVALALAALPPAVYAQLNENCVVSVLNRTVQVKSDGSWVLPNIPAGFGQVKARATCVTGGVTTFGESPYFTVNPNGSIDVPAIVMGNATPVPTSLGIASSRTTITQRNGTAQLTVTAAYANNTTRNVTAASSGTTYNLSNPRLASISPDGLVTALASGTVLLQAINEGTPAFLSIEIALTSDSDGDGIPDDAEIALGLDPRNPADGALDFDGDGLTNLEEYRAGTNMRIADTDGDGLSDGAEVKVHHTNPLVADSDGDGIPDGVEVRSGTNPNSAASFNLSSAVQSLTVTPSAFTLIVNSIVGTAYTQLNVRATLIDGTTILDLTNTSRGTAYSSSNLQVCNFGSPDGRVFAGDAGNCNITVTAAGRTVVVPGSVRNFTPTPLSNLNLPGFPNKIKVQGNYAYIAAGAAGLQIVNVVNKTAPVIVGSIALPGNANDVEIVGTTAYIAAGSNGLQIVDVSNPAAPVLRGSASTGGTAQGIVVRNGTAYVAASSQLTIINVSNSAAPLVASSVSIAGNGKAITLDTNRNLAIVALGSGGIQVFNIANPAAPSSVSTKSMPSGDSRGVKVSGMYVFVADYNLSLTSIDLSNPANPVILSNTRQDLGGRLNDVALSGNFALGADVYFVNGVPITDIGAPATLVPRDILNFSSVRDDDGHGVAVDSAYVYMIGAPGTPFTEFGTTASSRLYIGQYLPLEDRAGVPPTVAITSPLPTDTLYQGSTVTISADATDDVSVGQVVFTVNGAQAFVATSTPYQFSYSLPVGTSQLVIKATATDLGSNSTSATRTLTVVPDPLTTVTGRVIDSLGQPVAGATVTANGNLASVSGADGRFSIPNVPTVLGPVIVNATATVSGSVVISGSSAPIAAVRGGNTAVGDITAISAAFETNYGTVVTTCDDCFVQRNLPFPFTYYGQTYTTAYVGSNGYITFGNGDGTYVESLGAFTNRPRISAFFDDLIGAPGVFVNDTLPGRFVVTYNQMRHYSYGGSNTLQITLFSDGRILFGYKGITATQSGNIVGLTPGPGANFQQVNFSQTRAFEVANGNAVYEYFTSGNPFDLDNGYLLFTPRVGGGFGANTILQTAPPQNGNVSGGPGNVGVNSISNARSAKGENAASNTFVTTIANAEVEVVSSGNTSWKGNTNTDARGQFSLDSVPPGGLQITLRKRGVVVGTGAAYLDKNSRPLTVYVTITAPVAQKP